jgi:hypothetical protein
MVHQLLSGMVFYPSLFPDVLYGTYQPALLQVGVSTYMLFSGLSGNIRES